MQLKGTCTAYPWYHTCLKRDHLWILLMAEWLTAFCSKFSVSFLHGHGLMALQRVLCLKVLCSLLLLLRCSCRLAVLYYSTAIIWSPTPSHHPPIPFFRQLPHSAFTKPLAMHAPFHFTWGVASHRIVVHAIGFPVRRMIQPPNWSLMKLSVHKHMQVQRWLGRAAADAATGVCFGSWAATATRASEQASVLVVRASSGTGANFFCWACLCRVDEPTGISTKSLWCHHLHLLFVFRQVNSPRFLSVQSPRLWSETGGSLQQVGFSLFLFFTAWWCCVF
jgi:hypothetical protein